MKRFLIICIVLIAVSCNGQDFTVSESLHQTVAIKNAKYLIIECYCENGVVLKETEEENITIDVAGILQSLGYHGEQTKPTKIGKETLSFKTEVKGDTLKLISKEWTFMHHSYLIEKVKFQIPDGMKHEIRKIKGQALEGRKRE